MDWELYSFIVRSDRRKGILVSLNKPKTPTEISKEVKVSVAHVSRTLKEFSKKGIIECLTPKAKVGRIYQLTAEGKILLEMLKNSEK